VVGGRLAGELLVAQKKVKEKKFQIGSKKQNVTTLANDI
jgi:hypothetical protein